jgi:hypothetical protein
MAPEQYIAALERQRKRIADGLGLLYWDDTTVGAKSTHQAWGLCSNDKEAWPNAEDHLWPDQFVEDGRVAPKYFTRGQVCPFDTQEALRGQVHEPGQPSGCFYRCMFFQARRYGTPPDRKRALELYDAAIETAAQLTQAAAEER